MLVTVGGTIPADDIPELEQLGVAAVFTPGAPTQSIIDFIARRRIRAGTPLGGATPGGGRRRAVKAPD